MSRQIPASGGEYVSEAGQVYEKLIAPIENQMRGIALRIVRDPDAAADVVQETLAHVWRRLRKIDRDRNPHGYILRICVSQAYEHLRRRARRLRRETKAASHRRDASRSPDPAVRAVASERAAIIRDAAGLLPPKQAKAILLHAVEGSSHAAVAAILGCSPATARSHYSKGIARLRTTLTDLEAL